MHEKNHSIILFFFYLFYSFSFSFIFVYISPVYVLYHFPTLDFIRLLVVPNLSGLSS